ncbi:unnamed protein product, partial [Thlaspi arvense]
EKATLWNADEQLNICLLSPIPRSKSQGLKARIRVMILKISGGNVIRFVHKHISFQTNATCIQSLLNATCRVTVTKREMVTLIVATTSDPASINPAAALLAMPGWTAGPILSPDIKSFTNQQTRVIQHDKSIVREDDLDLRWEEATGEAVDEVIFLSRHTAVSNRPALTVHPIGVLHLKEGESPPQGGKPGWAALTSPRIGPWFRLLKKMAEAHNLVPEFEITLEGTHHGPITSKPTMFLEIGLGLGGGEAVGNWNSETGKRKVLLGIGGGHYAPRHMDIVLKDDIWVGHLLSGYSIPMEEPKPGESDIGGTWRQSIKAAFEATKASFPGGEILAHLDQKSFKGWQRKAITDFLAEENINVGKPNDFT